ncbi:MAG: hypothetical protein RMJ98_06085 [Myxococcales bacterium]|nr:hypothetical protein [Polyangiaceae bacterium]MDW8248858.1 hypothetical protein [Myxococcales bacterium]
MRVYHLLGLAGCWLIPATVHGQTSEEKLACAAAHGEGQDLRKAGKLLQARARFARCAQATCPQLLVPDCVQWSSEVQQAIPTVVFAGMGTDGKETSAIKVLVDGLPLVDRLDGKAIELDPGEHTFLFEHNGKKKQETFLIREGERNRMISVSFAEEAPPKNEKKPPPEWKEKNSPKEPPEEKKPLVPAEEKPSPPVSEKTSSGPTALLVTGLAGLGVGLGFGAWALSLKSTVASKCDRAARTCTDEDGKNAAGLGSTVGTISTAGTILGLAGLGAWLLWPRSKEPQTASLDVGPTAGGGMVRWQGRW